MTLRFGTAGIPRSTKGSDAESGIRRVRELGLDHMEMEWVHRVSVNPDKGSSVSAVAEECDVTLTAHGPYYINLNSDDPKKVEASIKRVLDTARQGSYCGAKSVLFHAAFMMKRDPEEVYVTVRDRLKQIMNTLRKENISIDVRPELMGKPSQWGSLEEIIRVSKELDGIKPAVDFSHQHARTGGEFNTYEEFRSMLEAIKNGLGRQALKDMHIHVSGIKYGPKGEREHLNFADADFNWRDLIKAFVDYDVEGYCVCESPNLEEDALTMQRAYRKLTGKKNGQRVEPST